MGSALTPEMSKLCRNFILLHWGDDGIEQVQKHPVTWALYEANPRLKVLRRTRRQKLPLITISGGINRIRLELSTERPSDQNARRCEAGQQPLRRK